MIFYKPEKNSSHFLSPIIVALDYRDKNKALAFVDKINPQYCQLKVGNEMFTLYGPEWIKELQKRGFQVFLDLKFHDIPNTTARSVASAAELGVWMVNVHASGGGHMMESAKKALLSYGKEAPLLIAVTLLTSMTTQDLQPIGIYGKQHEQVTRLAELSQDSGMDGVVCSAQEAQILRQRCGSSFQLVTPGIRPLNSVNFDQSRTMDPKEALKAGANYLVIGRPITGSEHPVQSLKNLYTLLMHS
ncbi:orotidine-5'-phosphate decarboxylase [Candidatus Williamhamiltonella defendens]|uniref:orotidine-5'-phosphate decarboxylase n=1 Tax=Candidatus Williamhamiltonella defendens TaxID=138072 RepID=UPI00130DE6BD|nr:orotidine-5'-phosphate decarboxylase [Candidatus Hamiltonella defensa]